jgi:hypothetical protein
MSDRFLSRDDLVALTGYRRPALQIRWLVRHAIPHWVERTGRPVVPVAVIEGQPRQDDGEFTLGKVA